jgi:hypothetical protein
MTIVTRHSFESTFYNIPPDEVPDLSVLHEMAFAELETPCPLQELDVRAQTAIRHAMNGIERICQRLDLIPYIVELSVIADRYQLKDRAKPFFTSFVQTPFIHPGVISSMLFPLDDRYERARPPSGTRADRDSFRTLRA